MAFRTWQQMAGFDRLYPFHSLRHYAECWIMPSVAENWRISGLGVHLTRHNQRLLRNAKRWSAGRYRLIGTWSSAVLANACSFISRLACRYI